MSKNNQLGANFRWLRYNNVEIALDIRIYIESYNALYQIITNLFFY